MNASRYVKHSLLVLTALLASGAATIAQTARQSIHIDATIDNDSARTLRWTEHREITPLSPAMLRKATQIDVMSSKDSAANILAARILKADGQRVDLAPSAFVDRVVQGNESGSIPSVSVRHAEFPDLALGDTAILEVHHVESRHPVPGQISWSSTVIPDGSQIDIAVRLDTPADVTISHSERGGFAYRQIDTVNDRRTHSWSGFMSALPSDEKNVADPQLRLPAYAFSTFDSYEAVGRAYGRGVLPALEPRRVIIDLARLITADVQSTEGKVSALFTWVQRLIRSTAVDLAANPYVPNAPDRVVVLGSGDCKDKATLLTALLGAIGIRVEQVLVSSGTTFDLPVTPLMQAFDHVIVYVPELGRYLDPTLALATPWHLPEPLAGKPVVRVAQDGSAIVASIPVGTWEENEARLSTRTVMDAEGLLHAHADLQASGDLAEQISRFLGIVQTKGSERAVADLASFRSMPGKASLVDRPVGAVASGWTRIATEWSSAAPLPLHGAAWHVPSGLSPMVANLKLFLNTGSDKTRTLPVLCRPGRVVQEDEIILAPNVELTAGVPAAIDASVGPFTIRRTWAYMGHTLSIRSEAISNVTERRCSAELANALQAFLISRAGELDPPLMLGRAAAQ